MSYLRFVSDGFSPSGKTKKYLITTLDGNTLGAVSWYAPWRRYAFHSCGYVATFDSNCLQDIVNFLDKLNAEHKEAK
jgi:hypothetical protein